MVQHNVGMMGSESERGTDSDGRVTTSTQVDTALSQVVQDFVTNVDILDINSTQGTKPSRTGQHFRESFFQLMESINNRLARFLNSFQQTFIANSFDNLENIQ